MPDCSTSMHTSEGRACVCVVRENSRVLFGKLRHLLTFAAPPPPPQVRMSPDIGQDENRLVSHNERMGMFRLNKRELHIFPFTFVPMAKIIERSTGQAPPQ